MNHLNKQSYMSLCSLLVITLFIDLSITAEFSYKDVNSWPKTYPQCGGQRQSPIALDEDIYEGTNYQTFSIVNSDKKPLSSKLLNEGNRIRVVPVYDDSDHPFLTGEVFNGTEYVLDSMHFHWSRVSDHGSEHIVFGYPGTLEMHFVHYKREYGSFGNALNFPDGLTAIGGIFDLLPSRWQRETDWDDFVNTGMQSSPALSRILDNIKSVAIPGSSVDIEPFAMSEFRRIQVNETSYLSYLGSMSSPPCVENVLWLISTYPYGITSDQLETLQSTVEFDHGDDHNNRPIQPTNGRRFGLFIGVMSSTN